MEMARATAHVRKFVHFVLISFSDLRVKMITRGFVRDS
jgi:hypothetical protein